MPMIMATPLFEQLKSVCGRLVAVAGMVRAVRRSQPFQNRAELAASRQASQPQPRKCVVSVPARRLCLLPQHAIERK